QPPTEPPAPQAGQYDGIWEGTVSGQTSTGEFQGGRFGLEIRNNAIYRISASGFSCPFEAYPKFPGGEPISGDSFGLTGSPFNPQTRESDPSIRFTVTGGFSSPTKAAGNLDATQNGGACATARWSVSKVR
ncbi:MAG: serine/threonine protein kinase, partial [Chloroflexales bacterium]|nr:serine/threonine protein kinase [Chloroflexales bacterium]